MAEKQKLVPDSHIVDTRSNGVPIGSYFHEPVDDKKKEEIKKTDSKKKPSDH